MNNANNVIIAYTDGSSTNAGTAAEAGIGINFEDMNGNRIAEYYDYMKGITSNEAEYYAIIQALELVLNNEEISDVDKVIIRSDSQLAVQQIKLQYECNNKSLLALRNEVHRLMAKFNDFDIEQIPREQNKFADKLSKMARKEKSSRFVTFNEKSSVKDEEPQQQPLVNNSERPTWDEYFMTMAYLTAKRSSCLRRGVGAVIVKNDRVIATGYNGAPSGMQTCREKGYCMRDKEGIKSGTELQKCYALHAEMNALLQCGILGGTSTMGATLYVTHYPCSLCTKMIIQAGINRIVYAEGYPDDFAKEILNKTDISVEKQERY